ncbi:MAG: methyl-accepting chemotaxis protein [Deltaproteobacteria bacterium]|jgi:methyl-accepting chemotaxis protein|nr:methyl-accepting chemotaxis protein [Deltaproteobacteria bacterium]
MASSIPAHETAPAAGAIRRSLGTQVLLLIFSVTLFIVGTSSVVGMLLGKQSLLQTLEANGEQVSKLLQMAIEKPMLIGDDATTSREFATIAKEFPTAYVNIASFNGIVTYATNPADVRKPIDALHLPGAVEQYKRALQGQASAGQMMTVEGSERYVRITPIMNAPACYHCHGKSQKVLGAMLVRQDVSQQVQNSTRNMLVNVLVSLAGGLLLACIIFAFLRRRVSKRLQSLAATSDSIIAGDFSAHFAVRGADELGRLSQNLETMLVNLKKHDVAQSVLNGMSIPCVMCGVNAEITFINGHLLDLLEMGESEAAMKGKDVHTLFYAQAPPQSMFRHALTLDSHSVFRKDETIRSAQGKELQLRFDLAAVSTLEGERLGVFATVTDLTAVLAHEAAVTAQAETIQNAAERAETLTHDLTRASAALRDEIANTREQANRQHALTDSTSDAVHQMNHVLEEMAGKASAAAGHAEETKNSALIGKEQSLRVAARMREIVQATSELKTQMEQLGEKTGNITKVMQLIQDIADQTNLLALNAAIEAARAGDVGRGFAVVADEVRKLAEKTMQATVAVGDTIKEVQQGAEDSITAVENAAQRVMQGADLVRESEEVLQSILDLAESVADQINAIAAATEKQSASSEKIGHSTAHIKELATQTMEASLNSERAIAALSDIAAHLNAVIESMRTKENT